MRFQCVLTRCILSFLLFVGAIRSLSAITASSSSYLLWNDCFSVLMLRGGSAGETGAELEEESVLTYNTSKGTLNAVAAAEEEDDTTVRATDESDSVSISGSTSHGSKGSTSAITVDEEDDRNSVRAPDLATMSGSNNTMSVLGAASISLDSSPSEEDEEPKQYEEEKVSTLATRRREFLDRIALISSSLLQRERPDNHNQEEYLNHPSDDDEVTPQSDLTRPGRHIHLVTTAALPWFTGTAVNPLLRAAMLHRRTQEINRPSAAAVLEISNGTETQTEEPAQRWVTLVVPWLELPEDQLELYGKVFASEADQEDFIRAWLRDQAGMPDAACPRRGLEILFYPARYHKGLRSVFAMGDMIGVMDSSKLDICILEEPEHCNWYRAPGDGWTKRFNYVVGIIHTNYREYVSSRYHGLWTGPSISLMSSAMVRAYCHKVIRLSPALESYAPEKEETSNVHGVRDEFLQEGSRRARVGWDDYKVYFIGKILWDKGLDIMLDLEDYYKTTTGEYFAIDIYGDGPDRKDVIRAYHGRREKREPVAQTVGSDAVHSEAENETSDSSSLERDLSSLGVQAKKKLAKIKKSLDIEIPKTFHELRRTPIPAKFPGRVDHATLKSYKVFVNPSITEVLCTTTAEALAMGKFAIIPVHPSNTFFYRFPNCLAYRNKFEFVANLRWALTHDPEPLSPDHAREFTWEAATDRLVEASAITWKEARRREKLGSSKLDERIAWLHNEIGKGVTGDMIRKILGGGPIADQVRYTYELEQAAYGDDDSEDEDDGLSPKFRKSSFAEAIRATISDLSSFLQ